MQPWQTEDYDAAEHYKRLMAAAICWACEHHARPKKYRGPWLIERAHIVNKPRVEDRRVVVMLCTLCHKASHGERIAGDMRPPLKLGHLLEIKAHTDPDWFDLEFLQKHTVRKLPKRLALPGWYVGERERSLAMNPLGGLW